MYIIKTTNSWVNKKNDNDNDNYNYGQDKTDRMFLLDDELKAPIAKPDIEEFFDFINSEDSSDEIDQKLKKINKDYDANNNNSNSKNKNKVHSSKNLADSISLCDSLEDLVKTFDHNVKKCLSSYNEIDVGQLAPVQVRSQEDIINDSQIWYTLTGNFGNLLPIDYWSRSLVRKYHKESLNIKNDPEQISTTKTNKKLLTHPKTNEIFNNNDLINGYDDYYDFNDEIDEDFEKEFINDGKQSESSIRGNSLTDNFGNMFENDDDNERDEPNDSLDYEDDEELREQLDMHSMILSKSIFNDSCDLDEPIITAEQVLNEIESMMSMQDEYYDEMTPDSGCFSMFGLSTLNSSYSSQNGDLPNDLNGSYLKYINTFAIHHNENQNQIESTSVSNNTQMIESSISNIPNKKELKNLNLYELNELIEQIEINTKELSDTLIHELALRDELEYEKETRNTFISTLMSIQDKKRQLTSDSLMSNHHHHHHNQAKYPNSSKKKKRRSLISFENGKSTHLTTVIPYNHEIEYTTQHLQILNKLLKAINEDSHQVPELLTNYILKVVCPT